VIGEGTEGAVRIEPATLDFGTVLATEPTSRELTVRNVSSGNLHFALRLKAVSGPGLGLACGAVGATGVIRLRGCSVGAQRALLSGGLSRAPQLSAGPY
jgi:hypothetical protein